MYGGTGKVGRGGAVSGVRGSAAGLVKRNVRSSLQPSSLQRPSTVAGKRLPTAAAGGTAPVAAACSASEESFSLVTGNPLNFAMIIRLVPDIVEEIKRVEAQGGVARIRFDANPYNPSGNVIDVGGKNFRFTWSRETGDLCDIYEEKRSGDDGSGLLVESGGAWRKLNVQRVLDESTKNHVKMLSEEAERKLKSRKAIVLDHGNPSMKNQMKALAAAEVNPWRMSYKQKKEPPFKKRKAEPPSATPPKSLHKMGLSFTNNSMVRPSPSPRLSPLEQSGVAHSPFGTTIVNVNHASVEDITPNQAICKENASISESSRADTDAVSEKPAAMTSLGDKPTNLRGLLISLLMEKPKGMNLKALEKAVGDKFRNSARQIEPLLKKIAVFQAPGRYILKPGMELESFKKPSSASGSSQEDNRHGALAVNNIDQLSAPDPCFVLKDDVKESEEQARLNSISQEESKAPKDSLIQLHLPDSVCEKKVSDNSEGPACSSSISGSDSDSESDSSDSGSDSGSPLGSGNGSSSDSESDASSNSKEGSDEDVDIMTSDDDKETMHNKLQCSEPTLTSSPIHWKAPDGGPMPGLFDANKDFHGSDVVEIEKNYSQNDRDASFPNKGGETHTEKTKDSPLDHLRQHDSQVYPRELCQGDEAKGCIMKGQPDDFAGRSKHKSKRAVDMMSFDDDPECTKRLKGETRTVGELSGYSLEKNYDDGVPVKFVSDSPNLGRRSIDLNSHAKTHVAVERMDRFADDLDSCTKYPERSLQMSTGFSERKDKVRGRQDAGGHSNDRKPLKYSDVGEKHLDSRQRKSDDLVGKFKEVGLVSDPQIANSARDTVKTDVDQPPSVNGGGKILQRELSDLELGELREPLDEEASAVGKQLERKSLFEQSENKPLSDYWNLDSSKQKPSGRTGVDVGKASLPHSNTGTSSNQEGLSKKKTPEHYAEDWTRSQQRVMQTWTQQLPRLDHEEVGKSNNLAEVISKVKHNDAAVIQRSPERLGDVQTKVPACAPRHESKRGLGTILLNENRNKSNSLTGLSDKIKDTSLLEGDGEQKRRESSSDAGSSYFKYEKEEPHLRGPIKDFSQYKEYVQEYSEKYESYYSLYSSLELYSVEFQKIGRDLEFAKGRDQERYGTAVGQLMESFRQYGEGHKRLKKIFVVLHEEVMRLKEVIADYVFSCKKG